MLKNQTERKLYSNVVSFVSERRILVNSVVLNYVR